MDTPYSKLSQLSSPELADTLAQTVALRQGNHSLLIHRLPSELLIYIFELVLQMRSFLDYYKHLYFLESTCSHWKTLIESTSSFWTLISSQYTSKKINNILRKSGNAPLVAERLHPFKELEEVLPNRCLSLRLSGLSAEEAQRLVDRRHPILEFLEIRQYRHDVPPSNRNYECAPALQGLFLEDDNNRRHEGCTILSYAFNFRTLRYLFLKSIDISGEGSFALMHALQQNPSLQHVALYDMDSGRGDEGEATDHLQLAYLTTLNINSVSWRLVVRLLRSLQAPQLKKLNVVYGPHFLEGPRNVADTVATIRDIFSSSILFNARTSRFTIFASVAAGVRWDLVCFAATWFRNEGDHFYLETPWDRSIHLSTFLDSLRDALGYNTFNKIPIELHLDGSSGYNIGPRLQEISTLLCNLQMLCICAERDIYLTRVVCPFLSTTSGDVPTLPFPRLHTLDLLVCNEPDESAVKSMLQIRYHGNHSAAVAPLTQLSLRLGVALTKLDEPEELARLVAPGSLYTDVEHRLPQGPKCWGQNTEYKEWFYPPYR